VGGIYVSREDGFDRVTVRLVPIDGAAAPAEPGDVTVETVTKAAVARRGLPEPAAGTKAVLLAFSQGIGLERPELTSPGRKALKQIQSVTADDGRTWVILAVAGDGCAAVQAPSWTTPGSQGTPYTDITVDIRH
jgi:hypothetical protein